MINTVTKYLKSFPDNGNKKSDQVNLRKHYFLFQITHVQKAYVNIFYE